MVRERKKPHLVSRSFNGRRLHSEQTLLQLVGCLAKGLLLELGLCLGRVIRGQGPLVIERPGWVQKDLACDFIAYASAPERTCYLLPFLPLRRAWIQHGRSWSRRHQTVRAQNGAYVSASVAVPIGELYGALNSAMATSWT